MIPIFWTLLFIILYTYIGYGLLIYCLVKALGKKFSLESLKSDDEWPNITHLIAAYNEESDIEQKIINSLELEYPSNLYQVWVVTDGSTDKTKEIVLKYPQVRLFHEDERKGKINAVNRVMPLVDSEITIYSDANTTINKSALYSIVRHYENPAVGGVSGEKRVIMEKSEEATSSGEGIYWKYESFLKRFDYYLYTVVGAAGELFSIKTKLYQHVPKDTLIEDFFLTLAIAKNGYRIAYEPEAYAIEKSSASIKEESKRKIRISAGGLQAIWRLRSLFNIFKYGWLSFQFISHRVLRWTLAPLALPALYIVNIFLLNDLPFKVIFVLQNIFYLLALVGWALQQRKIKVKILFVPYYFVFMNLSVYLGFFRIILGKQSVIWERAARKQ